MAIKEWKTRTVTEKMKNIIKAHKKFRTKTNTRSNSH